MMENDEKKLKKKFIRNIIITIISLIVIIGVLYVSPNFISKKDNNKINVIINNKEITGKIKNEVIKEDDVFYLSEADVTNFFDKYLYYEKDKNMMITTYDKKVANIEIGKNVMNVNGVDVKISGTVIEKNGVKYLPISEMKDVYNINIDYIEKTNTFVMDPLANEQIKAEVNKKSVVKSKARNLSRTVEKLEKGEKIVIISTDKGWTKIRTKSGKIGYIKENKLSNKIVTREKMEQAKILEGKVNMVWDYYSEYATAPIREENNMKGINVVSPSFFVLEKLGKGTIKDKVGTNGQAYINWAHSNNIKVWAMFSNDSMIETTSDILNNYNLRTKTINNIINLAIKYKLDGINIDFENMYEKDKNLYSRFIIELYPRLKELGITLSVDVTAPDGGETWSMCYNRNTIANNSDYIVFMAYDQYGVSSKKSGTTAGYDWVKVSLNKFLTTEEIKGEKIILGVPFYTRLWKEDLNGKAEPNIVNMNKIDEVISKAEQETESQIERKWNEELKQFYVEYQKDEYVYKMWIENEKSIREKLSLIKENNLAGAAFWEKDRETENIWDVIYEEINK